MGDLSDLNFILKIIESIYAKLLVLIGIIAWFTSNSIKLNKHDKLLYDKEEVKITMRSDCMRNHDRLEDKMDSLTKKTEDSMVRLHERIDELPQKIKDLLK